MARLGKFEAYLFVPTRSHTAVEYAPSRMGRLREPKAWRRSLIPRPPRRHDADHAPPVSLLTIKAATVSIVAARIVGGGPLIKVGWSSLHPNHSIRQLVRHPASILPVTGSSVG